MAFRRTSVPQVPAVAAIEAGSAWNEKQFSGASTATSAAKPPSESAVVGNCFCQLDFLPPQFDSICNIPKSQEGSVFARLNGVIGLENVIPVFIAPNQSSTRLESGQIAVLPERQNVQHLALFHQRAGSSPAPSTLV
jgi:hypothetical protein